MATIQFTGIAIVKSVEVSKFGEKVKTTLSVAENITDYNTREKIGTKWYNLIMWGNMGQALAEALNQIGTTGAKGAMVSVEGFFTKEKPYFSETDNKQKEGREVVKPDYVELYNTHKEVIGRFKRDVMPSKVTEEVPEVSIVEEIQIVPEAQPEPVKKATKARAKVTK